MHKLFIPPALLLYSTIGMILLHFVLPEANFIRFPINLIGIPVAFFGFSVMGRARKLFQVHQTTLAIESPSKFICEGVFLKSRNPMYGGMFLLQVGIGICSMNVISLLLPLLFLTILNWFVVRREEHMMQEAFGDEYLEYKVKVRRWI